jgi:hypothetical protein
MRNGITQSACPGILLILFIVFLFSRHLIPPTMTIYLLQEAKSMGERYDRAVDPTWWWDSSANPFRIGNSRIEAVHAFTSTFSVVFSLIGHDFTCRFLLQGECDDYAVLPYFVRPHPHFTWYFPHIVFYIFGMTRIFRKSFLLWNYRDFP